MCGIVGIVDFQGIEKRLLIRMRDSMVHRGPDDAGIWINNEQIVGLAHRRLSIIDLSKAGRQPISDNEGKIWITYNGEIYNFHAIRNELESFGFVFKTRTDTEIIINAYKKWGTDCLQKFNGMFAFAIYDDRNKTFFLARDRVGKKPLYYAVYDKKFTFASEIKALLRDSSLPREIDLKALNYYLTFGYIGGDMSIFQYIRKLPPAHAMIYEISTKKQKIWNYWNVQLLIKENRSEDELLEELEALLEDSVRLRMISDVPLGAFLSGGIDSSIVVAMMSKVSNDAVKTFSIGFEENKYNELPFAKIVADHFKTQHHEIIIKPDAFAIMPELVKQFDEPFADSSMIPTYYVSKVTREYVTVALSGDGGDELFGGYTHYLGTLGNYYIAKFVPSLLRKAFAVSAEILPEKTKGKRQLLRLKYNGYGAYIDRVTHLYFKERYRKNLLSNDILISLKENFFLPEDSRKDYFINKDRDFINCLCLSDFKTYLPDDILVKVDRASMLVSLEVRAPILDYRIAEFSMRLVSGGLKVRKTTLKYLLKRLARKILPQNLNINRKRGFTIPISEWFRGELYPHIRDILLNSNNHFFKKHYIEKLLEEHRNGINHSGRLYTLLVFCLWEEEYLK